MHLKSAVAMLFLTASLPLLSQVSPDAMQGGRPLVVGIGVSSFDTEMFGKWMEGTTVWADWNFDHAPSFLRGFSVEAEGRDLDHGQPQGQKLRQGTAGGGPLYTWRHFRNFQPYGKFLVDFAAMDHIKNARLPSWYQGDIWTIYAPGGGVEYRVHQCIWVRTDYEYQFWRVKFFNPTSFLNPQGFTVGVSYDFNRAHAN
jgi:opacity protein-like surface antigen